MFRPLAVARASKATPASSLLATRVEKIPRSWQILAATNGSGCIGVSTSSLVSPAQIYSGTYRIYQSLEKLEGRLQRGRGLAAQPQELLLLAVVRLKKGSGVLHEEFQLLH